MFTKENAPGHFVIRMSKDEAYQLEILVINSHRPEIKDVPALISFQLMYLAEMAFSQIPEKTQLEIERKELEIENGHGSTS